MTKDEQFMIKLAELTHNLDEGSTPIDATRVGKAVGLSEKSAKNTVNMLAQTNFVKKMGGTLVLLTDQGKALVSSLKKST